MSDASTQTAPTSPRRMRWGVLAWMLAGLFAVTAGLSTMTARYVSRPLETLIEDDLGPEKAQSTPMEITRVPAIVVIEIGQVLKPVRDVVTSRVTVYLLQIRDATTSTGPAYRPLLELEHEFIRTPAKARMLVRTHATIAEPGTYVLGLGEMKLSFEGAGGPVHVRVDRVRASAIPFEVGAVALGILAVVLAAAAAVMEARRFLARVRRQDENTA